MRSGLMRVPRTWALDLFGVGVELQDETFRVGGFRALRLNVHGRGLRFTGFTP